MKQFLVTISVLLASQSFGQEQKSNTLPYYELPDYPEVYTSGTVAARMVDALGFRFYWATHNLKKSDLEYKANAGGRTTLETIAHIYDLSKVIVNSTLRLANNKHQKDLSYAELRSETLKNLKKASTILMQSDTISEFKIIFGEQEFPFWNQVNGPIADAIWHCGQIASYRRSSGNPINPKVNHFSGTIRN